MNDWTISDSVFELAREKAKERAATQWTNWMINPKSVNMWEEYNTTLNPNWVDPWFEHELYGIENDPATDYQITQNMYMIYCWLSEHGYHTYSITAMITNAIHESTLTGGSWEAGNHPYPGTTLSGLIGFNATSLSTYGIPDPDGTAWQFMNNWAHVWYNQSGTAVQWTPAMIDGYTGETVTLDCSGTWAAVKRFPIAREMVQIDGMEFIRPVLNSQGDPILNINAPANTNDGRGYGLVQFTPWTKLPAVCAHAYLTDGRQDFNEANRHWQLNLTLLLMIFEYQRELAMSGIPQSGGTYFGQWVDSNAALRTSWGAFYQFPYNPSSTDDRRYFGQSITWDQFAAGTYLTWFETDIAAYIAEREAQGKTIPTTDEIDWCRRQLAMTIWMSCYIQTWYADDYGLQNISKYALEAIKYWNAHDQWNIMDVPRPRDIPTCELDKYHLSLEGLIATTKRRQKKHVRTIFL